MSKTIKKLIAAALFLLLALLRMEPSKADVPQDVFAVFQQMQTINDMRPGENYTLPVGVTTIHGTKDQFLRRRKFTEIQKSGLSSGCGDYALVFSNLIAQRGYQTLIVDGAEISTLSLLTHFSGHAVVAVRKGEQFDWCLVDSTNRKIIDPHWSRKSPSFSAFGRSFWIGYCGPVSQYPIHNGTELSAFYTKTLAKIPRDFLNAKLLRLEFVVDDSLKAQDGGYNNPNLVNFLTRQSSVFAANQVSPKTTVSLRLKGGSDNANTTLRQNEAGQWIAEIGRKSACSVILLDYFENMIARKR